ncbi:MAG TPA: lipoyl domain-containing protein, partial [Caldilineaceae bacterium]|nr:lipoyl domain-containing protein [Caldilineaceae bacterium]
MATEILMPRLGWTMEEGVFGGWLKQDGDKVQAGDLLFTVETDKATQEIEAFESGILHIPPGAPKVGDVVPVGAVLGYLTGEGEAPPTVETQATGQEMDAVAATAALATAGTRAAARSRRSGLPAISPR